MLHLNIIKVKTPEEMGKAAADEFEAVIHAKPACVIGLATGSSPLPLYRELIARERAGPCALGQSGRVQGPCPRPSAELPPVHAGKSV